MQKDQNTTSSLVSVGDFGGLDTLLGGPSDAETIPKNNYLILGVSGGDDEIDPWLDFSYHITNGTSCSLEYMDAEDYSLGFSSQLLSFDLLTVEVLAGDGVGPERSKALLLGFGDETVLNKEISLFAKYYPFVYLSDRENVEKHAVWHLGTRIGGEQLGFYCTAIGDRDLEGWDIRLHYDWDKYSLSLGGKTFDDDTNYFLGWGFKL
jgi:hypothetical protein